jgi:hypothetical protein
MLTQVPNGLRQANRIMVLRHPNAVDALVFRRSVTRTAGAGAGNAGGLPTLGGLTVMDSEDEPEVSYIELGQAKVLFTGAYERQTINDRRDAPEAAPLGEALIEPTSAPAAFDIRDGDMVHVLPGLGTVIPFEVTNVINTVNIPPYVPRYELSAQGDLLFVPPFAASQAAR